MIWLVEWKRATSDHRWVQRQHIVSGRFAKRTLCERDVPADANEAEWTPIHSAELPDHNVCGNCLASLRGESTEPIGRTPEVCPMGFFARVLGDRGDFYEVRYGVLDDDEMRRQQRPHGWTCTCRSFEYRNSPVSDLCKHIERVRAAFEVMK